MKPIGVFMKTLCYASANPTIYTIYQMPDKSDVASRRIFADNLIAAREKVDWSQKDLAEKAKISQSFISYVESGKKGITIEKAQKLADALSISVCKLLHSREK